MSLPDFINTKRDKGELKIALDVIREFKHNESVDEYLGYMFDTWVQLEKLEKYLEHLVEGAPLPNQSRPWKSAVGQ